MEYTQESNSVFPQYWDAIPGAGAPQADVIVASQRFMDRSAICLPAALCIGQGQVTRSSPATWWGRRRSAGPLGRNQAYPAEEGWHEVIPFIRVRDCQSLAFSKPLESLIYLLGGNRRLPILRWRQLLAGHDFQAHRARALAIKSVFQTFNQALLRRVCLDHACPGHHLQHAPMRSDGDHQSENQRDSCGSFHETEGVAVSVQ